MEKRESAHSAINLLQDDKLNCSSSNPHFTLVLGYLLQLVESALYFLDSEPFESKLYFQSVFQDMIVTKNSSINNVDYNTVFSGEHAAKFEDIYSRMLGLWMDIQDDMMPHEATRADLPNDQYMKRLDEIYTHLRELVSIVG